jgi:hypothetical protein
VVWGERGQRGEGGVGPGRGSPKVGARHGAEARQSPRPREARAQSAHTIPERRRSALGALRRSVATSESVVVFSRPSSELVWMEDPGDGSGVRARAAPHGFSRGRTCLLGRCANAVVSLEPRAKGNCGERESIHFSPPLSPIDNNTLCATSTRCESLSPLFPHRHPSGSCACCEAVRRRDVLLPLGRFRRGLHGNFPPLAFGRARGPLGGRARWRRRLACPAGCRAFRGRGSRPRARCGC